MSGQRKKDSKQLSIWITKEERAQIEKEMEGVSFKPNLIAKKPPASYHRSGFGYDQLSHEDRLIRENLLR